jgi:uncharacterized membrane protein YccF (DUF307 family)
VTGHAVRSSRGFELAPRAVGGADPLADEPLPTYMACVRNSPWLPINARPPPLERRWKAIMSILSILLNILWIVFGGLWMAVGWVIAGIIMAITIIGLPWAWAAFNIAFYTLLPFGQKAVSRAEYTGQEDIGTGALGMIGNIIWLVLAGWWLALGHLLTAIVLAITIIGIPFAWAHLKLAGLALWPIGKMIVPADDAPLTYRRP